MQVETEIGKTLNEENSHTIKDFKEKFIINSEINCSGKIKR